MKNFFIHIWLTLASRSLSHRLKGYVLVLCVLLIAGEITHAQTVYTTPGTNNNGNYPPADIFSAKWTATAFIFPSSSLSSGTISTIGFYVWSSGTTAQSIPIKIYLKSIAASTLTAGTWTNAISGATPVFTGNVTFSPTGWKTINLSTTFSYSTASNLEVLVECDWATTTTNANAPIFGYTSVTNTDETWINNTSAASLASTTGVLDQYRPVCRVTITPSCSAPASVALSGFTTPICNGTAPGTFTATPSGGSPASYTYLWYLNGSSTGITTSTYAPGNMSSNGTVYCAASTGTGCTTNSSVQTITVRPAFSGGTISSTAQTICNGATPADITYSTAPSGGSTTTYQWYYQAGSIAAPTGAFNIGSWTAIGSASTSTPTLTGATIGALTATRTFALRVYDGGSPNCFNNWAGNAKVVTVLPAFSGGTISSTAQTICNNTTPADITYSAAPTGGTTTTFQWYYQAGSITAPTGAFTIGSWTAIGSASTSTPTLTGATIGNLTATRTFALRVYDGGASNCFNNWAGNAKVITVLPAFSGGTLTSTSQSICNSGTPADITYSTSPTGGTTPTFQWYYLAGSQTAPSGAFVQGSWTAIGSASTSTPTLAGATIGTISATTTYTLRVYDGGASNCFNNWAGNAKVVTVTPNPTITSFTPISACTGSGATITINGANYVNGSTSVTINGTTASPVTFVNSGQVTVPLPAGASGTGNVQVTTCASVTSGSSFTVQAVPTITSLSPTGACAGSGATVTINGGNYVSGSTSVTFNGTTASPVTFVNSGQITVPLPAGASTGNVVVTTCSASNGSSFTVSTGAAPNVATSLNLSGQTSSQISGSFTASGGGSSGYLIIASTSSTAPAISNGTAYTSQADVTPLGAAFIFIQNSASTSFSLSGLSGNKQYYFFIYAYNTGCAPSPAYATALTGNTFTCPGVPTSIAANSITPTSASISWTAPSGGATNYTVEYQTGGGGYIVASSTATSPYTLNGLTYNVTYDIRVKANNAVCSSGYATATSLFTTGCAAVTACGIEWSASNGFTPGSGTQIPNSLGCGTGTISADLAGGTCNTTYYYRAYATAGSTTYYGNQQQFTTSTPSAPASFSITAPANICASTTAAFSVPVASGVTYTWTVTGSGQSGFIGQGTNSITVNTAGTGTFTVSCTEAITSCSSAATNAGNNGTTYTVGTTPVAFSINIPAICSSTTATFSVPSVSGVAYSWAPGGTGFASIASGAGTNSLTINTNASSSVTISCTETSLYCSSALANASNNGTATTVGTLNTISLTSGAGTNNQTRCVNVAVNNITWSTTGATGATVSGLPTGVTGNWASNTVTISGAPNTATGSPFNYTVTLTGGCGTVTATGAITVNPLPTSSFTVGGGGTYCSYVGPTVTLSGSQTGVSYQLKNGGVNSGSPIAGTGGVLNFGTQSASGTYTVIGTNTSTNCQSTMSGSATVTNQARAWPFTEDFTGGNAVAFGTCGWTQTTSPLNVGDWSTASPYQGNNVAFASGCGLPDGRPEMYFESGQALSGFQSTRLTSPYINTIGITTAQTVYFKYSYRPIANNNPPFTLRIQSSKDGGATWSSDLWSLNVTNAVAATTGSFTLPAANINSTGNTMLSFYIDADGTTSKLYYIFGWFIDDINIGTTSSVISGGTVTADQTICSGQQVASNLTLTGYTAGASIVKWQTAADAGFTTSVADISNTTTTLTPSALGSLTADTWVRGVVQNGTCTGYSTAAHITVNANPSVLLITPLTANACVGVPLGLNATPSGGSGTYSTHAWTGAGASFLSATNITNPNFTNSTVGSYVLTYTVTDNKGCTGSANKTVIVNANPTASISPSTPATCAGVALGLTAIPAGGSGTYSTHAWTGGGASSLSATNITNPNFTNATNGSYALTYTVTDNKGCIGTANTTVTVNANPTASILPATPATCAGVALGLTATPAGGSGTYSTHAWSGTGASSLSATNITNPNFTNGTAGSYALTYTVTDNKGCTGSTSKTVTVNANPTASISPATPATCAGVALGLTAIPASGSGTYSNHAWTGTGASSLSATNITNPNFTNTTNGSYALTYTVTDNKGCIGTANTTVTVNPNPTASIAPSTPTTCAGVALGITATPAGGSGTYSTHAWTGGGASSLSAVNIANPNFTNATNGSYALIYTVTDNKGCIGTANTTVTVNANPTASISPTTPATCAGVALGLTATPAGGSGTYSTHAWTGGGASSLSATNITNPNFTNAASGSYALTYTVTDNKGCIGTANTTITVNANPTASISPAAPTTCAGITLGLTATPAGGSGTYSNHAWSGAGSSSLSAANIVNPNFTNATSGTYALTYVVTDNKGCVGTANTVVTVNPTITNNIIAANQTICAGGVPASLTGTVPAGGNNVFIYLWQESNDNSTWTSAAGTNNQQNYTPTVALNADKYYQRVVNSGVCSSTATSVKITVASTLTSGTVSRNTPLASSVCLGTNLTPQVTGGSGGAGTITDEIQYRIGTSGGWSPYSGPITANTPGAYYFQTRRTATGSNCTASAWSPSTNGVLLWTVNPDPDIQTEPATTSICQGSSGIFHVIATSAMPITYEWQVGTTTGISQSGGTTANLTVTAAANATPGATSVMAIVSNGPGCNQIGSLIVSADVVATVTSSVSLTDNSANGNGAAMCDAANIIYTATGTNGGANPVYDFKVNNVSVQTGASNQYSSTAINQGDAVKCIMTSAAACASPASPTSNTITATIIACGYTWTGAGTDHLWNNPANWNPSVPLNSCASNVNIPAVSNYPVLVANVTLGDVTLQSGATIDLAANNLSTCGNWNGGTASASTVTGAGSVILTGNAAQALSGKTQFTTIRVSKGNGTTATMQANSFFDVFTALELQSGEINVANGSMTFKSPGSSQSAVIDNFTSGYNGTLAGQVYFERSYDGAPGSYGNHLMGSPLNQVAVSQFGATGGTAGYALPNNCDETALSSNSPYTSMARIMESNGAGCGMKQTLFINSGNTSNGEGYWVRRNGSGTLTLHGDANLAASYSRSDLSNSAWTPNQSLQNRTMRAGWAAVSNPYPAYLNTTLIGTQTNFDNQRKVWITAGAFANSYQDATGQFAILAPGQAMMVHCNAAGATNQVYTLSKSLLTRTPSNTTFYQQANDHTISITATNVQSGLADITTVAFNSDATVDFDAEYDADKLSGKLNRHTLYTHNADAQHWLSTNVLKSITETSTVPMGIEPGATGDYTFTFEGLNSFDATSYITLEDLQLHLFHDIRSGDYHFYADSADSWERFVLHFTPAAEVATTDQQCSTLGSIDVTQPGTANWTYTLTDNNNTTVSSGTLNQTAPLTASVSAGTYTLTLVDNNNYTVVKTITVNGTQPITAAFTPSTTTTTANTDVAFNSSTQGASDYYWDFGDGTTATGQNVIHSYSDTGAYTVTLIVVSAGGCTNTVSQTVTVNETTTGLSSITGRPQISIWGNQNKVYIDFSQQTKVDATIEIYNAIGQQMVNEKFGRNTIYHKAFNNLEAAYYIVRVKNNNELTVKKVLLTK